MKYLITGGAGYIGSTICSALEDAGHTPIILDSLITGRKEFTRNRTAYKADIADKKMVENIFQGTSRHPGTVHCAALIVVPESVTQPYEYYQDNVSKSIEFFNTLHQLGYDRVVFSSSAALYDIVPGFMVTEEAPIKASSPYSRTKLMMEMVLKDFCSAYSMKGIALRFFNPIGADPRMRSGIHVKEPTHVLGKLVISPPREDSRFSISPVTHSPPAMAPVSVITSTCGTWRGRMLTPLNHPVRRSLSACRNPTSNYLVINLGTGRGVTVRELVTAFENVYGHKINKKETGPRPRDMSWRIHQCRHRETSAWLGS